MLQADQYETKLADELRIDSILIKKTFCTKRSFKSSCSKQIISKRIWNIALIELTYLATTYHAFQFVDFFWILRWKINQKDCIKISFRPKVVNLSKLLVAWSLHDFDSFKSFVSQNDSIALKRNCVHYFQPWLNFKLAKPQHFHA